MSGETPPLHSDMGHIHRPGDPSGHSVFWTVSPRPRTYVVRKRSCAVPRPAPPTLGIASVTFGGMIGLRERRKTKGWLRISLHLSSGGYQGITPIPGTRL